MSQLGGHHVWWGYATKTYSIRQNQGNVEITRPVTTCTIEMETPEGNRLAIATSEVVLFHTDINNKIIGREFAFRKAVKQIRNKAIRRDIRRDFHENVKHVA